MKVKINLTRKIQSEEAILICGLPGIAYIGKLSVDHLVRELKANLIGEVYSQFFSPYVLIGKDGIVELLRNEFYYFKNESGRDILFYTGNAQAVSPEGQYFIANKMLDLAIGFGVKRVYSIAAFLTNQSITQPSVYGTATSLPLLKEIKEYGVLSMGAGSISGMNGLVFGLAKIKQLEGICLLGETHGYQAPTGHYLVDAKAARVVLETLTTMLNLKVNMEPLDKQSEQMDELIKRVTEIERRVREELVEETAKGRTRYII